MWRSVHLVWTDVSEERITYIFRVEKSANEKPAWAGACRPCVNWRFGGTSVHIRYIRHHNPEDGILYRLCIFGCFSFKRALMGLYEKFLANFSRFLAIYPCSFYNRHRVCPYTPLDFSWIVLLPCSDAKDNAWASSLSDELKDLKHKTWEGVMAP
jgi:hypothetical protein